MITSKTSIWDVCISMKCANVKVWGCVGSVGTVQTAFRNFIRLCLHEWNWRARQDRPCDRMIKFKSL